MKAIFTFLLSIFSLIAVSQETYHIIHIKGDIKIEASGQSLRPGDKISADDKIIFSSASSMAAALSSKRGRYMIQPVSSPGGDSELTAFLKDVVLEASGKLSTRGILVNMLDLKYHFSDDYLILGGHLDIALNSSSFPMNDDTFFYVRYEYGDESINKKLTFNENHLYLDKDLIYQVDGQKINPGNTSDFELFFFQKEFNKSQLVNQFNPIFPDDDAIIPEVKIIVQTLKEANESGDYIKDEVEAYLTQIYGKVHRPNYNQWIKSNFGL